MKDNHAGQHNRDIPSPHATVAAGDVSRVGQDPHLLDYLYVVRKRRHTILATFAATVLVVGLYSFAETPLYEGRTQLLIETGDPNVVSFTQVVDEGEMRQGYYQTQYRLIRSRSVAKKTLDTLDLWNSPEFTAPPANAATMLRRGLAWAQARVLPSPPVAPDGASDESTAEGRVISALLSRLTISPIRDSRLVEIAFRAQNAKLAAAIPNAVAAAYIDQNLEFRFTTTREASSWLEQQLEQQRKAVETAEARLQRFREQNETPSFNETESLAMQKLTEMNAAVTNARNLRLQKEALYQQLVAIRDDPERLETFPIIPTNDFVQQQRASLAQLRSEAAQMNERLGERHPEMVRLRSAIEAIRARLREGIAQMIEAIRLEQEAAVEDERRLSAAATAQRQEALAMNRKAIDYSALEREAQSSRQIYEQLLQRTQETGISGELRTSNVRIVDRAEVPLGPVSPRRLSAMLIGGLVGLVLGVLLAFSFEYFDNCVKTPDEIEARFGLPSIGLIPLLDKSRAVFALRAVPPNFVEAFRALRTNVLFSSTRDGCLSIVVTSTGAGEGKTLVASHLAAGMAQIGRRVLLLDADMRRPRAHEIFEQSLEPGLSSVLVGATSAVDAVCAVAAVPNLSLLSAGPPPPNPPELLGSQRFVDLLAALRERYDVLIVDTPPVMAVTDAAVAAHDDMGVLFVIAADRTSRHAARRALRELAHARVRFVGAVLNRVDLERNPYYYSQYGRAKYDSYYAAKPTPDVSA